MNVQRLRPVSDAAFLFHRTPVLMTKPVVTDETISFDPLLEDLASYLARIRSSANRQLVKPIDHEGLSAGVVAVLKKLEEIYAPRPI